MTKLTAYLSKCKELERHVTEVGRYEFDHYARENARTLVKIVEELLTELDDVDHIYGAARRAEILERIESLLPEVSREA